MTIIHITNFAVKLQSPKSSVLRHQLAQGFRFLRIGYLSLPITQLYPRIRAWKKQLSPYSTLWLMAAFNPSLLQLRIQSPMMMSSKAKYFLNVGLEGLVHTKSSHPYLIIKSKILSLLFIH